MSHDAPCEIALEFGSASAMDAEPGIAGAVAHRLEQTRLADAGGALDHEHGAGALTGDIEESLGCGELAPALQQILSAHPDPCAARIWRIRCTGPRTLRRCPVVGPETFWQSSVDCHAHMARTALDIHSP